MPSTGFGPAIFQSFVTKTSPATVAPRLRALRAALARAGLDGFLIPRADAHRGESVPDSEARLAWVTSFTGSAGLAVVGSRKAALFVDSRYTLQGPLQTDTRLVTVLETTQGGVDPRIADYIAKGGKLGYDPWLHTPGEIAELTTKLAGKAVLVPSPNLVDAIWDDRPGAPVSPVEFLGHNRAGRTAKDKLTALRRTLAEANADVVVLTLPESINWLFNMRGRDVPNVPVVLGFALVPQKGQPTLFVDRARITPELRKGLSGIAKIAATETLVAELRKLGAADKRVWIDPATAPAALVSAVSGVSEATID
jgi:Xaa-Pro aminopeptidase